MSYLVIDDFRLGMDRRKQRVAGVPGALWTGQNGHITRGGDFERRKKFVVKYSLPSGLTFGLAQVNTQLYAFGEGSVPGGMPAGITYQRLEHPSSATMVGILDVTTFSSKLYVVAQFADGSIYHYYDGTRVTAWDTLASVGSGNPAIAAALAAKANLDPRYIGSSIGSVVTLIAAAAGTAFSISTTVVQAGTNDQTLVAATPQANVVGVVETRSFFTLTVSGALGQSLLALTIDGNVYVPEADWAANNNLTAGTITAAINTAPLPPSTPRWTATVTSNVVTVHAPASLGASANGTAFSSTGTMSSIPASGTSAGGVNAVVAVAQVSTLTVGGTYNDAASYTATVNGTAYVTTGLAAGYGISAKTYMQKVYSVAGSLLYFSAVDDPTDWSGTGSGFISMTDQDDDSEGLVGICQFQGRIAVFSRFNTQIWVLAVDPANNTFQQSVQNTGALSARSLLQYGNIDTFYLNDAGVRSMRARDASNAPAVSDVGVAIDPFIQEWMQGLTGEQIGRADAVIEPTDGRYLLSMSNRIFVYTFFEGSKIQAWSYYDLSDEVGQNDITDMVRAGSRLYIRAADTVYLWGGDSGQIYPNDNECEVILALPFLSGNKPGTIKGIKGFDVGLSGVWEAWLQTDPNDDTIMIDIGTFGESTYNLQNNPVQHPTPLASIYMTCNRAGYASVSNMVIHFDTEDEK